MHTTPRIQGRVEFGGVGGRESVNKGRQVSGRKGCWLTNIDEGQDAHIVVSMTTRGPSWVSPDGGDRHALQRTPALT